MTRLMTKQNYTILVVDDDPSLRDVVELILERIKCMCVKANDGEDALTLFKDIRPDLVILDVTMPKLDGFSVCKRIRMVNEKIPILFLSAKSDIVDKRVGFQAGADDWMVKPFSGEELQLRVTALLRRAYEGPVRVNSSAEFFSLDDLRINLRTGDVLLRGNKIDLTPKETRILISLAEHPGETFSKEDLIAAIWGDEYIGTAISISTYIRRIRAKIEADSGNPRYLQTVWSYGYRMASH